jgi:hypothetical protein
MYHNHVKHARSKSAASRRARVAGRGAGAGHAGAVTVAPVQGIFAAQEIRPQARVLAEDRGIRCVTLDYEAMRGMDDGALRLF